MTISEGMKAGAAHKCIILGGGGHARVLIDALRRAGTAEILAVLDDNSNLWKKDLLGVPIIGNDTCLPDLIRQGADSFGVGVGSVGDPSVRIKLFETGLAHHLEPLTVIHPAAVVSSWAVLGPGCQVMARSVINPCARLGRQVIVNTGAIVEHDCELGDFVHISPGARLGGTVKIEAGAHIGLGATVIQGLVIGERAIVGAGAVVVKNVEAQTVVAGVPAKPLESKKIRA